MAEMPQQDAQALHHGPLHQCRKGGEFLGVDFLSEAREHRGDMVGAARRLGLAKQIQGRQRCRRNSRHAGIDLAASIPGFTPSMSLRKEEEIRLRPARILGRCFGGTAWNSMTA